MKYTHEQFAIKVKQNRDTDITDAWLRSNGIKSFSLQKLTDATEVWLLLKAKKNYGYMTERDQALWQSLWYHAYTLGKPMSQYHKNIFRKIFKRQDRERKRK
jgi:hypothetical protein